MNGSVRFGSRTKLLLSLLGFCAFFAIMVAIDTAEYCRAWSQARNWTDAQKFVAPAMDAEKMHLFILAALILDTVAIVLATSGGLALGIATATESYRISRLSTILATAAILSGFAYSADMAIYFVMLGPRSILKGPVFDYNLRLQPPVAIGMAAFAILSLCLFRLRKIRGART